MAKIDRRIYKGTNMFHLVYSSIKMDVDGMRDYIEETAHTLNHKQNELDKKYEAAKLEVDEDDPWFDSYFQDEFLRLHKLFPSYTFNSLLVNQYSLIERWLRKICEVYQSKSHSKIKLSDIYGSDVEKCKRYLNLVAEVDFQQFDKEWNRIKFVEKLRHNIIHNASQVPKTKENDNLVNHLKKESFIEYEPAHGEFFIKDAQFLIDFDGVILSFFDGLTTALSAKRVLAKNSKMRYNNDKWGEEKSEAIVSGIITCNLIVDRLASNELVDKEQLSLLTGTLHRMAYNSTKLLAFFSDGDWETGDAGLIMEKGAKGLEHLKTVYK